jgi:heme exporter protein D
MEPEGGTSGVKPVDVDPERVELHDTDSSKLSVSTASVSMLPHLEATNAKRVLNEEEKKKRREARKLKREVREEEGASAVRREESKKR